MSKPLHDTLTRVLLDLALRQPDAADREAMLETLRRDGWIPRDTETKAA